MLYESTIEIERPIDEVFEAATCIHRCVAWLGVLSSRLDGDEPAHVGSTFTAESRLLSMPIGFKGIITELEPPLTFAFKTTSGFEFSGLYTFTPTERGTHFHLAFEVQELPAPIRQALNNRLAKKALENVMRQNQQLLKTLLEGDVDLWALTPPLRSA